MVDQKQFDELVESTTHYLQQLMNRVGALEKEVEALKAKKTVTRAKKND
jgi:uncharacterized small protein (DUF1192 family)